MFTIEFLKKYRETMRTKPFVEECRSLYKTILKLGLERYKELEITDEDGYYEVIEKERLFFKYLKEIKELSLFLSDTVREKDNEWGLFNYEYLHEYLKDKDKVKEKNLLGPKKTHAEI